MEYTIISKIRANGMFKKLALFFVFSIVFEIAFKSTQVFAVTGGPSQPEVTSFEPMNTNQMVDPFTGDFTYNIPLFTLPGPDGGYPFNLAYHSGASMDQEASWVGLGWNINAGAINRNPRSVPDDFGSTNDKMTQTTDMKPNWTVGVGGSLNWEVFGTNVLSGTVGLSASIYYNNYRGIGYNIGPSFGLGIGNSKNSGLKGDLGFSLSLDSQEGIGANVSAGVSLNENNAKNGSTYKMSLGVSTGFNSRTGWNERISSNYSVSGTKQHLKVSPENSSLDNLKNAAVNVLWDKVKISGGGSSSLSFANTPKSMSIPNEMRGGNGSFSFSAGGTIVGNMVAYGVHGYFNFSRLYKKNQPREYTPIGYLNYQSHSDNQVDKIKHEYRVKDFVREKDGFLHANTRNLGVPQMTYDIYSAVGQGIGNSFRPQRGDYGVLTPPKRKSEFFGGSFGFEIAGGTGIRTGFDLTFNTSWSKTEEWPVGLDYLNSLANGNLGFHGKSNGNDFEPYYFQTYGDKTVEQNGDIPTFAKENGPSAIELQKKNGFYRINANTTNGTPINTSKRNKRKRRSVGVMPILNHELLSGTDEVLPEYDLKYYDFTGGGNIVEGDYSLQSNDYVEYTRDASNSSHVAGYTAVNNNGLRYVYGLPAYNLKKKDVVFSVQESLSDLLVSEKVSLTINEDQNRFKYKQPQSNQYYDSKELSAYTHSHLLTSVLGTDYHDVDGVAGPSDGDIGYWVKFNYAKTNNNYKWRAPFNGVAYNKGYETDLRDGTGSYSYGEKEMWFMATAETKTHIVEFILSDDRSDGFGASNELQDVSDHLDGTEDNSLLGSNTHKLKEINIYLKSERYPGGNFDVDATPIKTVHFEYNYEICPGIPNYDEHQDPEYNGITGDEVGGKLTLKKVWFTYGKNFSGENNKYEFDYNLNVSSNISSNRVTYNPFAIDRWGMYNPNDNGENIDYPYISPFEEKADLDEYASLWNLKSILLPSGALMNVEYEIDDYAYVQDKVAMQMFPITSLKPFNQSGVNGSNEINYKPINNTNIAENRKVYFELENPIDPNDFNSVNEMNAYIEENYFSIEEDRDLYFKVKINLDKANSSSEADLKESVAGYVKVADIEVDQTSSNTSGEYQWGCITLDEIKFNNKIQNFHPFTEAGSRHLKINQPDVVYNMPGNANQETLSKQATRNLGASLVSIWQDIKATFAGWTNSLYSGGRLKYLDLEKSFIRLRTPDKVKYGGGHRVKKVSITDNWEDSFILGSLESNSTYGTVYLYETKDRNGKSISSGVAAYEPFIGNDENPLKKPVPNYDGKNTAIKTIYDLYSEGPYNENLYPSPVVGYSKVTQMSLNTYNNKYVDQTGLNPSDPDYAPSNNTTGKLVSEFYTAKDFPVISKNTALVDGQTNFKQKIPIFIFIGSMSYTKAAATQGYYIETNDMHGKMKRVDKYGQDLNGEWSSEPYLTQITKYASEEQNAGVVSFNGLNPIYKKINVLNNDDFTIWKSDFLDDGNPSTPSTIDKYTGEIGVDREFMVDTRYNESYSVDAGLKFNFETFWIIPAFFPWPSFSMSEDRIGTVVTNKVVHKTGIVTGTEMIEDGKKVTTESLMYDENTGRVLLTKTTKENKDYYDYNIPAHDAYELMGPAYENIGYTFKVTSLNSIQNSIINLEAGGQIATIQDHLFEGDEVIFTELVLGLPTGQKFIGIYRGIENNLIQFEVDPSISVSSNDHNCMIYRSGKRNLLNANGSELLTTINPENRALNASPFVFDDQAIQKDIIETNNDLYNGVISYSASKFNNKNIFDNRTAIGYDANLNSEELSYIKGSVGVWYPESSYTYVDDRIQNEDQNQDPDVRINEDGIINDVPMFNWHDPFIQFSTKWERLEQTSKLNRENQIIESRSPLGIYSAVYKDKNQNVIGTSVNSKYHESGFESFETYNGNITANDLDKTNLDFYRSNSISGRVAYAAFPIYYGGFDKIAVYDENKNLDGYSGDVIVNARYNGQANNSNPNNLPEFFTSTVNSINPGVNVSNGKGTVTLVTVPVLYPTGSDIGFDGMLYAKHSIPDFSGTNNSTISNEFAHSGQKSLKILGNGAEFLMGRVLLSSNSKYKFSGWIAPANINEFIVNDNEQLNGSFKISFYNEGGTPIGTTNTLSFKDIKIGDNIEGWYKWEIPFTTPVGATYVKIELPTAQSMTNPYNGNAVESVAYYDDIRLTPFDAASEAYVYNNDNLKLEATLDNNNYATFYYYDDEGNLFLIKRETENGIITVKESRSNIKKQ